jgi:hypothetical protein
VAGRDLSPLEKAPGEVVARRLSGTYEPRDVAGAPDGTHDLDVVLQDGSRRGTRGRL